MARRRAVSPRAEPGDAIAVDEKRERLEICDEEIESEVEFEAVNEVRRDVLLHNGGR
jgi:hypothetical protein